MFSPFSLQLRKKLATGLSFAVTSVAAAYIYLNKNTAEAGFGYVEENLEPPHFHWYHENWFHSLDHGAVRRGFQVFDTIGKPCHSMKGQYYRQMIGVSHTEDEVRVLAAAQEGYQNPPNDEGEITLRTGVPNDLF